MPFGIAVIRARSTPKTSATCSRMKCEHVITWSARADHPPLDAVDVRLRVLVHPALVAAVLGRVHGHQPRHPAPPRQRPRRRGDEPVVRMDEVEAAAELGARGQHVVVHALDPGDERVQVVLGELRLAHAMHHDAVAILDRLQPPAAAGDDVHLVAVAHELLRQLAHVPRQAALHDRRVFPRQVRIRTVWHPTVMSLRPAQRADAPAVTRIFQSRPERTRSRICRSRTPTPRTTPSSPASSRAAASPSRSTTAPVAFLALDGDEIDHLYVDPGHHRQGHGTALLAAAQAAHEHLELWVFQRNLGAIAFYEAHGFAIVASTDGADNEEHEPDHRMAWSLR